MVTTEHCLNPCTLALLYSSAQECEDISCIPRQVWHPTSLPACKFSVVYLNTIFILCLITIYVWIIVQNSQLHSGRLDTYRKSKAFRNRKINNWKYISKYQMIRIFGREIFGNSLEIGLLADNIILHKLYWFFFWEYQLCCLPIIFCHQHLVSYGICMSLLKSWSLWCMRQDNNYVMTPVYLCAYCRKVAP